jgi:transposase
MEKNIKPGKRGSTFKYEFSMMRKVVQELYSGTITRSDLCRKYNIPATVTLVRWERWYDEEQKQMLSSTPMLPDTEPEGASIARQEPLTKGGLEEELRLARLKIICLETMIDVAEETLQIEIRKKAGTKPSGE